MFELKSIAPVCMAESSVIQLMGITASGIRLYFTTSQKRFHVSTTYYLYYQIMLNDFILQRKLSEESKQTIEAFRECGPSCFQLVHIKTPPPRDEKDRRNILGEYSQIDALCYSQGACIMADTSRDDQVLLICTAPSVPPNQHELRERVSFLRLESNFAWDVQDANPDRATLYSGNELATQHVVPAVELLCLTQQGIHRIVKLRPVDELYEILQSQQLPSPELDEFFRHYSVEACAMCLIIICSQQQHNVQQFTSFVEGGNSSAPTELFPIEGRKSREVAERAEMAFFHYGGAPHFTEPTQATHGVGFHSRINLSIKFHGIGMFLSRVLAPLWKAPAFILTDASELKFQFDSQMQTGTSSFVLRPSISLLQLEQIRELLICLDNFRTRSTELSSLAPVVPKNQQNPMNTPIGTRPPQKSLGVDGDHQAKKQEEDSLRNVFKLLSRAIEAISLVQFLCYHLEGDRIQILDLPDSSVEDIRKLDFQELVCAKSLPITNILVTALIECYSKTQNNIEYIGHRLNDQCASYFSLANMKVHSVIEQLKQLQDIPSPYAVAHCKETLTEMLPIAADVDIQPVLQYYEQFQFFTGFVTLLLARASKLDPSNLAIQGAKDDALREEKLDQRMECYHQILHLYSSQSNPNVKQIILDAILGIDDKLCHAVLFMWYLDRIKSKSDPNAARELLELRSPYLEEFLDNNDPELLYRYYCIRQRFGEAARVACTISEESTTIQSRIEWLVDAIRNERACGGGNASGIDLHELTEKLDVAKIQLSIYNQINALPPTAVDETKKKKALVLLNTKLMDLTTVSQLL